MRTWIPAGVLGLCLLSMSSVFAGQPPRPKSEPRTIRVTVSPAAVPDVAMKYSFVPDAFDQVEGNAAQFYMRAMLLRNNVKNAEKDDELFSEYADGPTDGPNRKEAEKALGNYRSVIEQIEWGSLRETCRWEQSVRQQGISALLPELSQIRSLTRVLAAQARIQIANKEYDKAVHTLQVGFALTRHLNEQPVLIQGLVATATSSQLLNVVRDLCQQPDAPNLYWALASLPRPLVDPRQAMAWERNFLYFTFPQLKNAAKNPMSAVQWQKVWDDLQNMRQLVGEGGGAGQALLMASAFRDYGKAKKYLIATGIPAEQVEKTPVIQAVGIYFIHNFDRVADNMWKWWLVPYPQAKQGMDRSEEELKRLRAEDPTNPCLLLLPAVNRAYARFVSLDRDVCATQCVEAIRAYAAAHNGKLPASLEELTETPAPIDPTTGKPFTYRVNGRTAVIESPPTGPSPTDGLRVEITVR